MCTPLEDMHIVCLDEIKANESLPFKVHVVNIQQNQKGNLLLFIHSFVLGPLGFVLFSLKLTEQSCSDSASYLRSQS